MGVNVQLHQAGHLIWMLIGDRYDGFVHGAKNRMEKKVGDRALSPPDRKSVV